MFNQLAQHGARILYNRVLPMNLFQPQKRSVHEVNGSSVVMMPLECKRPNMPQAIAKPAIAKCS